MATNSEQVNYVRVRDINESCTSNAARCFIAPTNWNGQLGVSFDPASAVAAGWTEDPGCAGYAAANGTCAEGGGI